VKSIKTAFVVVVMLVVVYGAWVMINKKPLAPPGGMLDGAAFSPPKIEFPGAQPGLGGTSPMPSDFAAGGAAQQGAVTPGSPLPLSPPSGGVANPAYAQPSPYSQGIGQSPYGATGTAGAADGGAVAVAAPVVGPDAYGAASPAATTAQPVDSGWDNLRGTASRPSIYGGAATGQSSAVPPVVDGADVAASAGERAADALDSTAFLLAWRGAQDQLAKGELAGALETLTLWHDSPDVPAEMQSQLTELLDQLAGAVVYSTDHLIEPPHEVAAGETLEDIANQLQVPWQLLANLNSSTWRRRN
jgi:hypothetical protein